MNKFNKTIFGITAVALTVACGGNEAAKPQKELKELAPSFDISQIDSTIHPCEDFEKYAVGNWLKDNPVPESESRWGSFNIVHDANEIKLRAIVDEAARTKAEKGTPLQQVGDFYTSALDSTTTNELGIAPIQPLLDRIDAVTNIQQLVETMAETRKSGSGSIFSGYVGIDVKNSSQYIMHLTQGGLGLPDKTYYKPSDERGENIFAEYKKHIAALFVLAGKNQDEAQEIAKQVVEI
jgi:putative endopeptidase